MDPSVQKSGFGISVVTFGRHIHDTSQTEEELTKGGLLLLDFGKVDSLNSEDMGIMISLHKRLRADGSWLVLFNLSPMIYEVFEVCQFHKYLSICH